MSINQWRPPDAPTAPMYSPDRDLAHIYPAMMVEVLNGLRTGNWSDAIREVAADGLSEEALADGVGRMTRAHELFIRDSSVATAIDAFNKAEFYDLPPLVQLVLFARIGESLAGGFAVALRDVVQRGKQPSRGFIEMLAAGREFSAGFSGSQSADYSSPSAVAVLKEEAQQAVREMERAAAREKETSLRLLRVTQDEVAPLRDKLRDITRLTGFDTVPETKGFFSRLRLAVVVATRIVLCSKG